MGSQVDPWLVRILTSALGCRERSRDSSSELPSWPSCQYTSESPLDSSVAGNGILVPDRTVVSGDI